MNSKILPEYCYPGRNLNKLDGVVIHYFSAINVDPGRAYDLACCRNLFMDLNRPRDEREWYMLEERWAADRMYASAHLLIGRDGTEWKLVEFRKQAWHAGRSILNGREHCNRWTLGIELVGGKETGFTDEQYLALARILVDLMVKHEFGIESVAGHDSVRHAAIAAGKSTSKKFDPSGQSDGLGYNFDWGRLNELVTQRERVLAASVTAP